jgi:hypothetical protein
VNRFRHETLVGIGGSNQRASCPAILAGALMEKIMRKNIGIGIAVLVIVPMLNASPARSKANPFVQGTVIEVQKQKVYFPDYAIGGSNPPDAPLTSRYYAYQVSVRVDCKTYVGRYETQFNYLPSEFTPNQPIQVHLTKHVMYFDLPNDPDMRMGIVRRSSDCGQTR